MTDARARVGLGIGAGVVMLVVGFGYACWRACRAEQAMEALGEQPVGAG